MFVNLVKEMAGRRMTQKQLSIIIGTSERTVHSRLNGKSEFTIKEAARARAAFDNLSIDYLFEWVD